MHMREVNEYEKLYSLDVLGIEDRGGNDQLDALRDFKESFVRKQDGRHEVGSPWIPGATLTNTMKHSAESGSPTWRGSCREMRT